MHVALYTGAHIYIGCVVKKFRQESEKKRHKRLTEGEKPVSEQIQTRGSIYAESSV